jgi:Fe-S cluster assembly protein SufD
MYQFIQIHEGENRREFLVKSGTKLMLFFLSDRVKKADIHIRVRLVARGAQATITGVVLGDTNNALSIHTVQSHEAPETLSDVLVKTVLSGHAKCLFEGSIRVEKQAQKTDAYQRNENLLLSDNVFVESKPSLEILANDVRCTHGSATGTVNEDHVWYLATRGISRREAKVLLVRGFIQNALDRIPVAKRGIISL